MLRPSRPRLRRVRGPYKLVGSGASASIAPGPFPLPAALPSRVTPRPGLSRVRPLSAGRGRARSGSARAASALGLERRRSKAADPHRAPRVRGAPPAPIDQMRMRFGDQALRSWRPRNQDIGRGRPSCGGAAPGSRSPWTRRGGTPRRVMCERGKRRRGSAPAADGTGATQPTVRSASSQPSLGAYPVSARRPASSGEPPRVFACFQARWPVATAARRGYIRAGLMRKTWSRSSDAAWLGRESAPPLPRGDEALVGSR